MATLPNIKPRTHNWLSEHLGHSNPRNGTYSLWWLSFADEDKPKGEGFLGVCIVRASHIVEAANVAHELGINPGGQCLGMQLGGDASIPDWALNVLLNAKQATELLEHCGTPPDVSHSCPA